MAQAKRKFYDYVTENRYSVLYLVFFTMAFGWIILQPIEKAVAFSAIDDALYYPKIAYNIVARGLCTYDGITTGSILYG